MKEYAEEMFNGIKIVDRLLDPEEIVIGIENENRNLEDVLLPLRLFLLSFFFPVYCIMKCNT